MKHYRLIQNMLPLHSKCLFKNTYSCKFVTFKTLHTYDLHKNHKVLVYNPYNWWWFKGRVNHLEAAANDDGDKLAIIVGHSLVKMFRKAPRLCDLSWTGRLCWKYSQMLVWQEAQITVVVTAFNSRFELMNSHLNFYFQLALLISVSIILSPKWYGRFQYFSSWYRHMDLHWLIISTGISVLQPLN